MNKATSLPDDVLAVVQDKGTERPFSGEYDQFGEDGTYLCRRCGLALFRASTKFHSGCGWPSFDENIPEAVIEEPDADGRRTEILCARCHAHLGHVFTGEGFTNKSIRHCVNSLSIEHVADRQVLDTEEAIFAAGCFWGVEYYFKRLPGILKTEVGYSGGTLANPSYKAICRGDTGHYEVIRVVYDPQKIFSDGFVVYFLRIINNTGHYEVIRVVYDPQKINYKTIAKYFFEIHNPTQPDGQGPDRGEQYLSVAFYYDTKQQEILLTLIKQLEVKGYKIATKVLPVSIFWPAEDFHQDYYDKQGKEPYCHRYE